MSTQARAAYGTTIQRLNNASPAVYATIEEVTSIAGPAMKTKAIDVTNMDSSGVAEFIAGILDAGTISVEGNFTNATNQGLALGDFQNKTLGSWKVCLPGTQPGAGYFEFSAYVVAFSLDFKVTDRVIYKMELQITGSALPLHTS
jgi:predicted secreted protein